MPAVKSVSSMWVKKFGYMPASVAEYQDMDDRIVMPDAECAQLLKKNIERWALLTALVSLLIVAERCVLCIGRFELCHCCIRQAGPFRYV